MAHFAKISEQNEVLDVLSFGDDSLIHDENGVESEAVGQQHLQTHNNWPTHLWIKTSYNTLHNQHAEGGTPFRGNYAVIGGTWDSANNIFWPIKPFPSWVKDTADAEWHSPIGDAPDDLTEEEIGAGTLYLWNEIGQSWDKETSEA